MLSPVFCVSTLLGGVLNYHPGDNATTLLGHGLRYDPGVHVTTLARGGGGVLFYDP